MNVRTTLLKVTVAALLISPPQWNCLVGIDFGMSSAIAQTRYVHADITDGDGLTSGSPWSYQHLVNNAFAGNMQADTVFFLTGSYERTLLLRGEQGTEADPILLAAVAGHSPVFSGSMLIEDSLWQLLDGTDPVGLPNAVRKIHLAQYATAGVPPVVFNLYEGNALQRLARAPNAGFHRCDILSVDSLLSDEITGDWNPGTDTATLVLRYQNWGYSIRRILPGAHSGNWLTFDTVAWQGGNDWGFFLQNKVEALDTAGEWFVKGAHGPDPVLYYYPNGASPTNVRICIRSRAIELATNSSGTAGCAYIGLRGLIFEHVFDERAYLDSDPASLGVALNIKGGSHHIVTDSCLFRDLRVGMSDEGSTGQDQLMVTNCTFLRNLRNALKMSSSNATVSDNRFLDIGAVVGQSGEDFNGNTAVKCAGNDIMVENNYFMHCGGSAITAGGTRTNSARHLVRYNAVDSGLVMLNDHAAITFDHCDGLTVMDNIITRMVSNTESSATDDNGGDRSVGIYYGNHNITNTRVFRNTITGCGNGILLDHQVGYHGNVVENNTVFGCREAQLVVQDLGLQDSLYQATYDDLVRGNILYALNSEQRCMFHDQVKAWTYADTAVHRTVDYGTFDENYYFNPFTELVMTQKLHYDVQDFTGIVGTQQIPFTLRGWQQVWRKDLNATTSPLHLEDFAIASLTPAPPLGPISDYSDNFDGGIGAWDSDCDPLAVQEGSNGVLHQTNCWLTEKVQGAQALTSTLAGDYLFTFRARSDSADAMRLAAVYDVYTKFRNERYFGVHSEWRNTRLVVKADDIGAWDYFLTSFQDMQFGLGARAGTSFWLDSVDVRKCTLDTTWADTIAAQHILRYNDPLSNDPGNIQDVVSFNVPGTDDCWSDVYGNFYASGEPITLAQWESIVLFKFMVDPAPMTFVNDVYTLTGNEVWTENWNITGSVVVPDSITLIIDGAHIGFAESTPQLISNIVVEPGGTLIVRNGANLRNWMGCDAPAAMWDGVRALSHSPITSLYPGMVIVESGGTISNALVGVLAGDGDPADPGFVNTAPDTFGGVVRATNAVFRNNRIDVVAKKWTSTLRSGEPSTTNCFAHNLFLNSTFVTTGLLNDPELDPVAHLRLADVEAVVHGCTFANELPSHTESRKMGHGIEGLNAVLKVKPAETVDCIPQTSTGNTFRNLDHAIDARVTSGAPYAMIQGNTFTDNICGVYLSAVPGFSIVGNTFAMGRWSEVDMSENMDEFYWESHHRGIFTTGGFGFSIQDNTLGLSVPAEAAAPTEGIVVGYSQDHDDIVFRNTATGLVRAFVGEGICANVLADEDPGNIGLQFQCNENFGNATNFMGRVATGDDDNAHLHTIRARQGRIDLAAGNKFDQTGSPVQFDLNTSFAAAPLIFYYYQPDSTQETPNPAWLNNVDQELEPTVVGDGGTNACETPGPGVVGGGEDLGSLPGAVQSNKEEYGDLELLYDQLMDGGDTQELLDALVSAWHNGSYEVNQMFLDLSPFISAQVLPALIESTAFTDAEKTAILIANPQGTVQGGLVGLLQHMDFPQNLIDLITASLANREGSYRAELEMEMSAYHTDLTQAANHWLYLLRTDTIPPHADTLRMVWQQLPALAARYAEAALLLGQGQYDQADTVITNLVLQKELSVPEHIERERMLVYIDVLTAAAADSRSAYQLDSVEVNSLDSLVADAYDRPALWAGNLLCAVYQRCRAPYTGGGGGEPKARRLIVPPPQAVGMAPTLRLAPNPANAWVTIRYTMPGNTSTAMLVIRDASGRLLQQFTVAGEEGQVTWDGRLATAGVYSVELVREGRTIETQRLIIQP